MRVGQARKRDANEAAIVNPENARLTVGGTVVVDQTADWLDADAT